MLFDMVEKEDQIIVFYTKNSPHMSYASIIKLLQMGRPVQFEECFEGNNALDFQLISYLGYLMKNSDIESSEYIVMSNDTGFDAAVNFWKERKFPVNRINVNYCKLYLSRQKEKTIQSSKAEKRDLLCLPMKQEKKEKSGISAAVEMAKTDCQPQPAAREPQTESRPQPAGEEFKPEGQPQPAARELHTESRPQPAAEEGAKPEGQPQPAAREPQAEEQFQPVVREPGTESPSLTNGEKRGSSFDKEEVDTILNCLGRDNLTSLHEVLVHLYGQDQGLEIYKLVKEKTYSFSETKYQRADKVQKFADIIFFHSDIKRPGDFAAFLENNKGKSRNLNGIRAAIIKFYGDKNGLKYYSLFKPYFKMISALN